MSEEFLYWKQGKTAYSILIACIHAENLARFREIDKPFDIKALAEKQRHLAAGENAVKALQDSISEHGSRMQERQKILDAAARRVLATMQIGRLKVFGFQDPRKIHDLPHDLTEIALKGRIDWEKGHLTYQSMTFVDLAFIYDDQMDAVRNRHLVFENPDLPPARGRPAIKDKVLQVVQEMLQDGSYDLNRTAKSQFAFIRKRLAERLPDVPVDDETPSDETIRRAIVAAQKNTKQ